MSPSQHINVTTEDRILTIKMDREDKLNALTREMYAAMTAAIQQAESDDEVRVILITGGDRCFTSGNDIADFAGGSLGDFESSEVGQFLGAIANAQKPVVGAVNGAAVGIGTTMLLHMDLVYAGEDTKFRMPFVNLGLCPEGASSLLVPNMIGRVKASELLLMGKGFSASEAEEYGIINQVCANDETKYKALETARALVQQPPAATRATKALLKAPMADAVASTMRSEGARFASMLGSAEAKEAFSAFIERRQPDFSQFK